jgi:hypothetical protein
VIEPIAHTPCGFGIYAEFIDTYGNEITVCESSAAFVDRVWLSIRESGMPVSVMAHLSPQQARTVRDALDAWLTTASEDE